MKAHLIFSSQRIVCLRPSCKKILAATARASAIHWPHLLCGEDSEPRPGIRQDLPTLSLFTSKLCPWTLYFNERDLHHVGSFGVFGGSECKSKYGGASLCHAAFSSLRVVLQSDKTRKYPVAMNAMTMEFLISWLDQCLVVNGAVSGATAVEDMCPAMGLCCH